MGAKKRRAAPRGEDRAGSETGSGSGSGSDRDVDETSMVEFWWVPKTDTLIKLILAARLLAALYSVISDCDESYNYWEPTHYMLYGTGMQTWEYSPVYALRSYFYLAMHAFPVAWPMSLMSGADKVYVFFAVRAALAVVSAAAEVQLVRAAKEAFGERIAHITWLLMMTCTGMFIASTAFLPSTFAMYCITAAWAAWVTEDYRGTVYYVAAAGLIGWPFSLLAGLPMALHVLVRCGPIRPALWGCGAAALYVVPSLVTDYVYYRKVVFAVLNIAVYNTRRDGGSELYGVEPWYYYLFNSMLNFNVAFLFAVAAPILPWLGMRWANSKLSYARAMWYLSPAYLWFVFMSLQPHKEERFLFVIFPLMCVAAACGLAWTMDTLTAWWSMLMRRPRGKTTTPRWVSTLYTLVMVVITVLALARSASLVVNYSGSMETYKALSEHVRDTPVEQRAAEATVCVGKEWYRFPSHFFLPKGHRLAFLDSNFGGQLPKHYAAEDGTSVIPTNMNNMNEKEMDRFVGVDTCDYIVDLDLEQQDETHYLGDPHFTTLASFDFLDANASRGGIRALCFPFLRNHCVYRPYVLLKRKDDDDLAQGDVEHELENHDDAYE